MRPRPSPPASSTRSSRWALCASVSSSSPWTVRARSTSAPRRRRVEPREPADEGGDPACWAGLVCPECGAIIDGGGPPCRLPCHGDHQVKSALHGVVRGGRPEGPHCQRADGRRGRREVGHRSLCRRWTGDDRGWEAPAQRRSSKPRSVIRKRQASVLGLASSTGPSGGTRSILEVAIVARPVLLSVSFGDDWSWVDAVRAAGIVTATQVYD